MSRRSRAQERYLNDPVFCNVVNSLRRLLAENTIDVGTLMEAAVEAANIHYATSSTPVVFIIARDGEIGGR